MPKALARLSALALLLGACTGDPAESTPDAGPAADDARPPSPAQEQRIDASADRPWQRPETVVETVVAEGMDEQVTLRLVHFPEAPLPFSTYVYDTWDTDLASSGEGTAVRMTTGEPPFEGVLSLFVPAGAPTEAEIVELARSMAESNGGAQEMVAPADWVRTGYSFRTGDTIGTVQVGAHAGTWFYVYETFPIEMGDGFGPASAVALDRLRWDDDGTGL